MTVAASSISVSSERPRVIAAPLAGEHWIAVNGPDNTTGHRRTLLPLSGSARIAQRFATDWVQLYEDGRTFRGDPAVNGSYRSFGAEIRAVADGTLVEVADGVPDNVPHLAERAVAITPRTLSDNYVLLDIGRAAFAVFDHLQPGSVRVRRGDRVRRGQTLGRLGNSGNSSEPHLHFHVTDRANAFDIEVPGDVITPSLFPVGHSLGIQPEGLAAWQRHGRMARRNDLPMQNRRVPLSQAISTCNGRAWLALTCPSDVAVQRLRHGDVESE